MPQPNRELVNEKLQCLDYTGLAMRSTEATARSPVKLLRGCSSPHKTKSSSSSSSSSSFSSSSSPSPTQKTHGPELQPHPPSSPQIPTLLQKTQTHHSVWTVWYAAQYGKTQRIQSLLDRHAVHSIDVQEYRTKWSALHFAARYGQLPVVELLLARGADPDLKDLTGNTPLHLSAGWGNLRCTVLLLEAGAQVSIHNQSQQTPLDVAKTLARHEQLHVLSSWQPLGLTPEELLERRLSKASFLATDPLAKKITALQKLEEELQDEPDAKARQELHALCAKIQAHGESHASVLVTLDRLVCIYRDTNRLEKALSVAEQALTLVETLYTEWNAVTLTWLNNTSELLLALGRLEECEQLLKQALLGFEATLGENDLSTLDVLENLAVVTVSLRRPELAESYLRELLRRLVDKYGDGWNDRVFQLTLQLGVAVLEQKRVTDAQEIFNDCLTHARTLYGDRSPHVASCIEQLGRCAFLLGDLEQSESLFQQSLQLSLSLNPSAGAASHRRHYNNLAMLAIARKSQTAVEVKLQEELYRLMAVSGASRGGVNTNKTATSKKRAMQVNVVVRVRPSLPHEKQQPVALTIAKSGQHSKGKGSLLTMQQPQGDEASEFLFEKCYDDATPQRILFQREIQPAIAKVLDGINTTVFAYGATGTGKTFTMEGSKRNLGMIPRSVKRLFEVAAEQKKQFQIDLSYLEIYNDRVLDLLVNKSQQTDLPIRQQTDGTIAVQGLTRKRITSLQEFEELYEKGSASRARAPTDMNPESSRSHSILMLQARSTGAKGHEEIKYGKLHLIDLAGSEDNRRTGNSGARLQESGKINMSLFVLGKVITALNSGDLQRIPFRDSKLTRLLQDSLGGSSHAVMICNVAQSAGMYTECLQTLNYAAKAKGIVNQVVVNTPSAATKAGTKKATAVVTAKTTAAATMAKTERSTKMRVVGSMVTKARAATATKTTATTSATARLQKAAPVSKPLGVATARKPLSLTSSTDAHSTLETKLSAWRESKQREKRTSTESASSSTSSFSTPATAAVGMKRPSPTALPSSTSSTVSVRKLTSRMSIATTTSALRVPVPKKPRLSVMPTTNTTAPTTSSSSTISRKSICPNPVIRRSAVGSPAGDKENVPSTNTTNKLKTTTNKPTLASAVNLVKDLTPVDLAKKLIGVAIDLEKKKQFTAAYAVFKRAYHVLPEENPKLVERLHALETQAPSAPSLVPCQQMSTAVYMQLVLEINLLEILNRGSQQELTELHSIGDKRAEKIVETRPFSQLSDLLQVPGITEKLLQKLHDHHIQW